MARTLAENIMGTGVDSATATVLADAIGSASAPPTPAEIGAVAIPGDTMTGPLIIQHAVAQNKLWLAMHTTGTGHNDAPTVLGRTSAYMQVGGREYGNGGYGGLTFGYVGDVDGNEAPVWTGYVETDSGGNTKGDYLIATRDVTTNTAPTPRLRVTDAGDIKAEDASYVPATTESLTDKKYVDGLDGANVKVTGAQTVAGVKTFSASPIVPTPTTATQAADKGYVDGLDGANVKLTGAQTVAGVKTFSSLPVLPASDATTDNEAVRKALLDARLSAAQRTAIDAVTSLTDNSGGTANDTVEAIPDAVASVGADTSAATVASVNASIAAIKNDVADLAAKVNAIVAALKAT